MYIINARQKTSFDENNLRLQIYRQKINYFLYIFIINNIKIRCSNTNTGFVISIYKGNKMESKTYFYHFRYKIASNLAKWETKLRFELCFEPIKYCHSNGGVTVAVREEDGKLYFGATKCSLVDSYNKKLGRLRAKGVSTSSNACVKDIMGYDDIRKTAVNIAENLQWQNDIAKALANVY